MIQTPELATKRCEAPGCGREFSYVKRVGGRPRLYCSTTCQQRAHYRRVNPIAKRKRRGDPE